MSGCCAVGCSNNSKKNPDLIFHTFPTKAELRSQWTVKINRLKSDGTLWTPNTHRLCSAHFADECYVTRAADNRRVLKPGAVPSKFSHLPEKKIRKPPLKRGCPSPPECQQSEPHVNDHTYTPIPIITQDGDQATVGADCGLNDLDTMDLDAEVTKLEKAVQEMKVELHEINKLYERQKSHYSTLRSRIDGLFNEDQLCALQRKGTQGMVWSEATIRKALQLKFACGKTGYKLLLDQGQPLPCIQTLQRRMKNISFCSGILPQVFDLLKLKVSKMKSSDRYCSLTLDEMSIETKTVYDSSSGQVMGGVTLPDHTGLATHGIVFMLSGIASRWKQTVAYYFSGNSTDGAVYHRIILELIRRADEVGLIIVNVTTDMGSPNQAMWRSFGVGVSRVGSPSFSVPHPCLDDRRLYFLADVPHVVKNLRAALCKHRFQINAKSISIKPIEYLAKHDQDRDLKLAPKLKVGDINSSHFDKMKVSGALHVFSKSAASGIRFLVKSGEIQGEFVNECMDTAWFIDLINHWFDLMSSRNLGLALSRANVQKYDEEILFLRSVVDTFYAMKIGAGSWKPVQTGVILSTLAVINLSDELLARDLEFLMTSRLTQDCLENLFSTIRLKSSVPSVVEFRDSLKIVTVAQFLKTASNSSYQVDESTYLGNYLEKVDSNSSDAPREEVVVTSNALIADLDSS